jgi:PEP-CTERM motif
VLPAAERRLLCALWNNSFGLQVGVGGAGTLTVQNGGTVSAQTIDIGTLGVVDAKGGTLIGNVINGGTLDPLGTANIVGDFTQNSDGTLLLDVAGTGLGEFGQIDITSSGVFDGLLNVDFIDGFAPQQGDVFDFVNLTGSGDFTGLTTEVSGLLPGFEYSLNFADGSFDLTALNDGQSAAPEPGTLILLGMALMGLALLKRSKRIAPRSSKF